MNRYPINISCPRCRHKVKFLSFKFDKNGVVIREKELRPKIIKKVGSEMDIILRRQAKEVRKMELLSASNRGAYMRF
jgi:hypothetical protein